MGSDFIVGQDALLEILLFEENRFLDMNMKKTAIIEKYLQDAIRQEIHFEGMENIKRIFL